MRISDSCPPCNINEDLDTNLMKINLDFIYPIGSLYITVSTVSPEVLFGGTWEKITGDAYLKIVQNDINLGQYGGTNSDHKIPVGSLPSHNHGTVNGRQSISWANNGGGYYLNTSSGLKVYVEPTNTTNTGSGNAYYPYYYGVYVWKRVA